MATPAEAMTGERATLQFGAPPKHHLAPASQWPWLPSLDNGLLQRHPFCERCGQVKAVGTERAFDLGGLSNVLGHLDCRLRDIGLKLTEAQRRLILQRMRAKEADDRFALSREAQFTILSEVAGAVIGLRAEVVRSCLRSR